MPGKAAGAVRRRPAERERYVALLNASFDESTRSDQDHGRAWGRWAEALYRVGDYKGAWEKVAQARSANAPVPESLLGDLARKMPQPRP